MGERDEEELRESLRASEAQLRLITDATQALIAHVRADRTYTFANRQYAAFYGRGQEEVVGAPLDAVLDPTTRQLVEPLVARVLAGEEVRFEAEVPSAAQGPRWLNVAYVPDVAESGVVAGFHVTAVDMTDRRRAEVAAQEERAALELLNETLLAVASELDLERVVHTVTDATTRLCGARFGAFFYNMIDDRGESYVLYALSGAPRSAFDRFGLPRNTPVFDPTFRGEGIVRSDDITRDPRYGRTSPHHGLPKGHLPVRSYLAVPVVSRSGEVIGGLFFGHPEVGVFTERCERLAAGVAVQAAAAIDNARLYESAQKAAERERAARAEADRHSALKDAFLATVSHELRTPLSAILGWAQILKRGASQADLRTGVDTIERNARVQARLIEDLLDTSRIMAGKVRLELQLVDPVSFVEAALQAHLPAAQAKGVALEHTLSGDAGTLEGDPSRLQQIVWNLVSNAIKFTAAGGRVVVGLRRQGERIEISVEDTGLGIDPEFLPHLFERFRQADGSTTRRHGGLGLGLSIVRQLTEMHGGTVRASSAGLGAGSRFVVELPVAHRPEAGVAGPGSPASTVPDERLGDLSGLRVLVVDDEPDGRAAVAHVLAEARAQVLEASGAEEALALVARERPDVLVSDIGMPGVDGYELLRRLRALGAEAGGRIPAVALTAFVRPADRVRALRAGFQVHLSKPVEPWELVATVGSVAGRPEPRT